MDDTKLNFLHPLHKKDLEKSGLSDKTIIEAGIKSVCPGDINKKLKVNITGISSIFEIPYAKDYSRYKIFYEPGQEFFQNGDKKPKYLATIESKNKLYIPTYVKSILHDVSIPLYITEGEKKALKAAQENIYCIGISGLWNWKDKDSNELLSDFSSIKLKGRTIYIVPDNDWLFHDRNGNEKNLKQAVYRLAYLLIDQGAKVYWIELPTDKKKLGLDDYLCEHTVNEFKNLPRCPINKDSIPEAIEKLDTKNVIDVKMLLKRISMVTSESERDIYIEKLAKKKGLTKRGIKADIKKITAYKKGTVVLINDDEIYKAMKAQQDGDAFLFVKIFKNKLFFDHSNSKWFKWNNHYWLEDRNNETITKLDDVINLYAKESSKYAEKATRTAVKNNGNSNQYIEIQKEFIRKIGQLQRASWKKDVLELAAAGPQRLGIVGDEWDQNPLLLGCANGVIDLDTGKCRDGKPDDYIKSICPTKFNALAGCPKWQKFLSEIFSEDEDLINFIKRLLGYSISGLTVHHILPICWGSGRNGKGTLFETLGHVLGSHIAKPIKAEMLMQQYQPKNNDTPSPGIMSLRGKRLVWGSETEEGRRLNINLVKWLTGGDTLTGRKLYSDDEDFKSSHTLFLFTNNKPHITPGDLAIWDRVLLIPFENRYIDNPDPNDDKQFKVKPSLLDDLKEEAEGILYWLIEGYANWKDRGLDPPKKIIDATKEYRKSEDIIAEFIQECCIEGSNYRAKVGVLRKTYEQWCNDLGISPIKEYSFKKIMNDKFKNSGRTKYGYFYEGIGILNQDKDSNNKNNEDTKQ